MVLRLPALKVPKLNTSAFATKLTGRGEFVQVLNDEEAIHISYFGLTEVK